MIWVAALAAAPACNLVIGNDDGYLLDPDGAVVDAYDGGTNHGRSADAVIGSFDALPIDSERSTPPPDVLESRHDAPDEPADDPPSAESPDSAQEDEANDSGGEVEAEAEASPCPGGATICAPGATQPEMQSCGACGSGFQTRKRTCAADGCAWGAWSAWSSCMQETAACLPGQTENQTQACGPCNTGTQTRTRTCTSSCTWGAWGAFGSCGNTTYQCLPDHWRCCGPGKWEWCYYNTCKWTGNCAPCNGSCSCS